MYQNMPTKCLTGEVRLSYANLIKPRAPIGANGQPTGDPKYSVTLLIPKTDKATYDDLCAAINAAAQGGLNTKFGGYMPALKPLIHDGDGTRADGKPYGDECKGHWVLTASTKNKPQVVGIDNINCELAPQDIYSGMYARVTVNFFAFNNQSKGVGCGLGNVLKTRDGEPLSGGASAASDFAGIGGAVSAPATPAAAGVPQQGYTAYAGYAVAPGQPMINPLTGQPM